MRRQLDAVLLLDKPVGLGSNTALQAAKRLYRAEKAGHPGTLDPLASGLLPILFGEATKFSQLVLDADKEYLARARLGVTTRLARSGGYRSEYRGSVKRDSKCHQIKSQENLKDMYQERYH